MNGIAFIKLKDLSFDWVKGMEWIVELLIARSIKEISFLLITRWWVIDFSPNQLKHSFLFLSLYSFTFFFFLQLINEGQSSWTEINEEMNWLKGMVLRQRGASAHNPQPFKKKAAAKQFLSSHSTTLHFFLCWFKEMKNCWEWFVFSLWKRRADCCHWWRKKEEDNPTPSTIPSNEGLHASSFIWLELLRSLPRCRKQLGAPFNSFQFNSLPLFHWKWNERAAPVELNEFHSLSLLVGLFGLVLVLWRSHWRCHRP